MSRRAAAAEGDDAGYAGSTPMYDPSAIEHMKLTLDDDSPYPVGGDDDDDDENEEEEQVTSLHLSSPLCWTSSLHGVGAI